MAGLLTWFTWVKSRDHRTADTAIVLPSPKYPSQSTQRYCFHLYLIADVTSGPRSWHILPAPLETPLSFRHNMVCLVSTRVVSICSCSNAATVGGFRVMVDSLLASPTTRSFPRTLACSGQKIHWIHWRLLRLLETTAYLISKAMGCNNVCKKFYLLPPLPQIQFTNCFKHLHI